MIDINQYKTFNERIDLYRKLIEMVENKQYEEVGKLITSYKKKYSSQNDIAISLLISTRIALNSGNREIDLEQFKHLKPEHAYLIAEIHFIKGLICYHNSWFTKGAQEFTLAYPNYEKVDEINKALLCQYNAIIGKISDADEDQFIPLTNELQALQKKAYAANNMKMLGLIHRQKSFNFELLGRHNAALDEAVETMDILENHGPNSDFQLAICQVVDCLLHLKKLDEIPRYLETVIPPIDSRVEFPYAYIKAKIDNQELNLKNFEVINPHWKEKYQNYLSKKDGDGPSLTDIDYHWNYDSDLLQCEKTGETVKLKKNSLDGKLIRILIKQKTSKNLIIEKLWPQDQLTTSIDNRLHKLISRINQKLGPIISFDGTFYSLSKNIIIK